MKLEVHHIIPEASGGPNDFDNAVGLCFDCHADAGHYNADHPWGTKFSRRELRLHRDTWYAIVTSGGVATAPESRLHCRYFVCKSFGIIREIASGDLERLPVTDAYLARTPAGDFLQTIVRTQSADDRKEQEWGEHFPTVAEYLQAHPAVAHRERLNASTFPYFEAMRVPSSAELSLRVAPVDAITRMLLSADVRAEYIAYALGYTEICNDDRFQEVYRLRPLWALYLTAQNLDIQPVVLESLVYGVDMPTGLGYRPLWGRQSNGTSTHTLPRVGLAPGATAIIPVAALLAPLWPDQFHAQWTESRDLPTGQGQDLSHGDLGGTARAISVIGPALWPKAIRLSECENSIEHQIHEFDQENVYTLSRYWECGSCPHLLFEMGDTRRVVYVGELFARGLGELQEHRIVGPPGVSALVIAELEDETTSIQYIDVNGTRLHSDLRLTKGDTVRVDFRVGDRCCLRGSYLSRAGQVPGPWRRNEVIAAFVTDRLTSGCT